MDVQIGTAIGPWVVINIKSREKDRCIAVVKQIGKSASLDAALETAPAVGKSASLDAASEEYIMKISLSDKEYKFIRLYNLAEIVLKLYKYDSELYGKYKGYYWFVMEKYDADCSNGNIFYIDISKLIESVIKFLKYLHREHRVIHRDIKLSNILYKEGKYTVADYELIREPDNESICDEHDYDNYYYYSYGAEYGKPVLSYRYDLQAVGYMLMVMDNKYEALPFQKKAHTYYNMKSFKNHFEELNKLRSEYEMPERIKAYFKLIESVDWFSLEPPGEDVYDSIIKLFC